MIFDFKKSFKKEIKTEDLDDSWYQEETSFHEISADCLSTDGSNVKQENEPEILTTHIDKHGFSPCKLFAPDDRLLSLDESLKSEVTVEDLEHSYDQAASSASSIDVPDQKSLSPIKSSNRDFKAPRTYALRRGPKESKNPFEGCNKKLFAGKISRNYKYQSRSTTRRLAQDAVEDARREILQERESDDAMTRRQLWLNLVWADRTDEFVEILKEQFDPFHPSNQRFDRVKRRALAKTFPQRYFCLQNKTLQCGLCSYKRPQHHATNVLLLKNHLAREHRIHES